MGTKSSFKKKMSEVFAFVIKYRNFSSILLGIGYVLYMVFFLV